MRASTNGFKVVTSGPMMMPLDYINCLRPAMLGQEGSEVHTEVKNYTVNILERF